MRIGINAAFLPPKAAGVATYTRALVEHLSESGYDTFVYSPDDSWQGNPERITWRRSPDGIRGGKLGSIMRVGFWYQTVLPLRLARDKIDVLLSTMQEGTLTPVCPQVVVVHDLIPLIFPQLNPAWFQYYKRVLPRVLRASARVIAVSECSKRDILRHYDFKADNVDVVYNWINPVFLTNDTGSTPEGYMECPYFLYVGKSATYKNIEMVLRAYAIIRPQLPHRMACVVSTTCRDDREYLARMIKLAKELGIEDRLTFYSGISLAELQFLYRHATALVLLSKYEGFGYPPLEAMATGTPAIVSDSTSLAEVGGPGAVCVPNTEPEPAAYAMKKLACDSAYRAELSEAGRAHARQFTRERSGLMIRSILERCAGLSAEGAA